MRAIVISEKRWAELFERLTDTTELQKFRSCGQHHTVEDYQGFVHYHLHSFVKAVKEDEPWCPDYAIPKD